MFQIWKSLRFFFRFRLGKGFMGPNETIAPYYFLYRIKKKEAGRISERQPFLNMSNRAVFINSLPKSRPLKADFENILGKGENAGYQHFLLFLKCFSYLLQTVISYLSSADASDFSKSKIVSSDNIYSKCSIILVLIPFRSARDVIFHKTIILR